MAELETRRIQFNGIEMAYDEAGSGGPRPFVLVHGFTGSLKDFETNLPELAQFGRTLSPALRGHSDGHHAGDVDEYTLDHIVDDLIGFFDALGIERCDLLGHSMGGLVVQRLTLKHPERVASLVLMDTAGRALHWMPRYIFEWGGRIARWFGMRGLHAMTLLRGLADPTRTEPDKRLEEEWGSERYGARIRNRFLGMDPVAFGALGLALVEHPSLLPRLAEIVCPTLVMVGAEDPGFLQAADELEQAIPGAHRVTLPDAAHQPQLENPEAWHKAVAEHLQRVRA